MRFILSSNCFLRLSRKLINNEVNKKIIDTEIALGKRNKPIRKENFPIFK